MALNIKSAETDRLARELSALTGESITEAVTRALAMRLEAARHERDHLRREQVRALIDEIRERAASRPVLDKRSDEEILGYNELGTFD